jgi:hypothetical protein
MAIIFNNEIGLKDSKSLSRLQKNPATSQWTGLPSNQKPKINECVPFHKDFSFVSYV